MNFNLIAVILAATAYAYTYTINMTSAQVAWYNVTNVISAAAWIVLAVLIHLFRAQAWRKGITDSTASSARHMMFAWIRPLTYAFKTFALLSAVRYIVGTVVIYWHIYFVQNALYFLTNIALAVAVGYASVYYKRLPTFLVRLQKHQLNSRRFEVIAEYAPDAIIELDTLSNIWYANRATAEIFGYDSPKDLLGINITDVMPERFRTKHMLGIERYLETGESNIIDQKTPVRLKAQRKNGEEFPIELTLSRYDLEEATRFCAVIRDISYKVALEHAVEEQVCKTAG